MSNRLYNYVEQVVDHINQFVGFDFNKGDNISDAVEYIDRATLEEIEDHMGSRMNVASFVVAIGCFLVSIAELYFENIDISAMLMVALVMLFYNTFKSIGSYNGLVVAARQIGLDDVRLALFKSILEQKTGAEMEVIDLCDEAAVKVITDISYKLADSDYDED